MHHPEHYPLIYDFIADIGLQIAEADLPHDTFLPGIALRAGGLIVDRTKLLWPGDLLHEAGHLAVLPADIRANAEDDLVDAVEVEHAGEQEAMAWAYAAAKAVGIPVGVLIHDGGYKGRSADILSMYEFGIYPGLRGLCAIGLAFSPGFTPAGSALQSDHLHYPNMLRWLRD
jgi:hypothetical protein